MSTYHTIDIPDITDQDAVRQFFWEIQNPGTNDFRVRIGADSYLVYTRAKKRVKDDDKVSEEKTRERWAALERIDALAKELSGKWNTDETGPEIIANSRR